MPFLDHIVSAVNAQLATGLSKCFSPEKIKVYGITESVLDSSAAQEGARPIRYPIVVDNNGEGTMVAIDDRFDIILYHKLESITTTLDATKGFGDSLGNYFEQANFGMMVASFREKTGKTASWLESIVKDEMPQSFTLNNKATGKRLFKASLKPLVSNFDKYVLLQREYTEAAVAFPHIVFFEIKYRIESSYKAGCFQCNCV